MSVSLKKLVNIDIMHVEIGYDTRDEAEQNGESKIKPTYKHNPIHELRIYGKTGIFQG